MAPRQAVPLLSENVKPVKQVSSEEIEMLIHDLDAEEFERREKASDRLRHIGIQAKARLERSLARSESREVLRRVKEILAALAKRDICPIDEDLREIRAIEVLEAIGTPEAKATLESLAKGASGVRLTAEARAALDRLGKK
jgi:hypothetical protein